MNVVEAAYDWTCDESAWLGRLLEAAAPALDQGFGLVGMTFDLRGKHLALRTAVTRCAPSPLSADYVMGTAREHGAPIAQMMTTLPCGYASEAMGKEAYRLRSFLPSPIRDVFRLTGVNPTGEMCLVSANVDGRARISRDERETWERVTSHLAAGYRLRRALANRLEPPEAIFTPSGDEKHAEGEAQSAREHLQRAVLRFEHARSCLRSRPEEALANWRPLVAARWTLLEEFERGGHRFIVARRNETRTSGLEALTGLEKQVLALLGLGHSSQLIAYELGIAASTVSELLSRASKKLGARFGEAAEQRGRSLSPREREVASLICLGFQNKEIAAALGTSVDTVRKQTIRVYEKTELSGRVKLTAWFGRLEMS